MPAFIRITQQKFNERADQTCRAVELAYETLPSAWINETFADQDEDAVMPIVDIATPFCSGALLAITRIAWDCSNESMTAEQVLENLVSMMREHITREAADRPAGVVYRLKESADAREQGKLN